MILQLLKSVNRTQAMQIQDEQVLTVRFELIPMAQDDKQTLQRHLNCLVVLYSQQFDVVSDYSCLAVEGEDELRVPRMGHIREYVANLTFDIVAVLLE